MASLVALPLLCLFSLLLIPQATPLTCSTQQFTTLKVAGEAAELNQLVRQVGSSVTNGVPDKHGVQSGNLNLVAGVAGTVDGADGGTKSKKKNRHGLLNTVSWGFLFPVGVIVARYLKTVPSADPIWFYVHVFCQLSAFVIGVAGWGTGVKLGAESPGLIYRAHRNFGIALFIFATLQIIALLVRPKKEHKYRHYWNIYHHGFGYGIVVLGIINVFKGLDILQPGDKYRFAYVFLLVSIVVLVVVLEISAWRRKSSLKKKNNSTTKPYNNNGEISSSSTNLP